MKKIYLTSCLLALGIGMNIQTVHSAQIINQKLYGLELGVTRLIYKPEENSASFRVKNNQPYPILVQAEVYNEDKVGSSPFIVTPPIQKIESNEQTRLRVILTEKKFKKNQESLYWLCIKGIPPINIDGDKKNEKKNTYMNVNILSTTCIKLFIRPTSIDATPEEAGRKLKWNIVGKKLSVSNESPLYVSFSYIKVNGVKIKLEGKYVKPFGTIDFDLPVVTKNNSIEWSVIDDYGAESSKDETVL